MEYVLRRAGDGQLTEDQDGFLSFFKRQHLKVGFEVFEHGIVKGRVLEEETANDEGWRTGHPILFPNILRLGGGLLEFQFRVPLDDEHTRNFWCGCFDSGPDVALPTQTVVPLTEVPHQHADGRFVTDFVDAQDLLTWAATGPSTVDRQKESLGESDVGIILYRRLLKEQMDLFQKDADPMNVFRDPAQNEYISVVKEKDFYSRTETKGADAIKYPEAAWYGPVVEALRKVLEV
jgi:5,5'-dehydrodivanillate O-demethylase